MSEWVVLLHVAVAFWFVAGLLGRNVTMARARSTNDLTVFLPHGKLFEAALEDARQVGEVTPELRIALRDPAVRNARAAEIVVVAIVVALMVTKPF